jgi:hypothetical protein
VRGMQHKGRGGEERQSERDCLEDQDIGRWIIRVLGWILERWDGGGLD